MKVDPNNRYTVDRMPDFKIISNIATNEYLLADLRTARSVFRGGTTTYINNKIFRAEDHEQMKYASRVKQSYRGIPGKYLSLEIQLLHTQRRENFSNRRREREKAAPKKNHSKHFNFSN